MMSCLGFSSLEAKAFTSAATVHDCCNRHQSNDASTSLCGHREWCSQNWLAAILCSCHVLEKGSQLLKKRKIFDFYLEIGKPSDHVIQWWLLQKPSDGWSLCIFRLSHLMQKLWLKSPTEFWNLFMVSISIPLNREVAQNLQKSWDDSTGISRF